MSATVATRAPKVGTYKHDIEMARAAYGDKVKQLCEEYLNLSVGYTPPDNRTDNWFRDKLAALRRGYAELAVDICNTEQL